MPCDIWTFFKKIWRKCVKSSRFRSKNNFWVRNLTKSVPNKNQQTAHTVCTRFGGPDLFGSIRDKRASLKFLTKFSILRQNRRLNERISKMFKTKSSKKWTLNSYVFRDSVVDLWGAHLARDVANSVCDHDCKFVFWAFVSTVGWFVDSELCLV